MARLKSGKTHRELKGKLAFIGIWVIIIITLLVTFWSQSNLLTTSELDYENISIPKSLNGYRIVNISDIDNTPLTLVSKVEKANPDVVILSGGYCDASGNYDNSYDAVQTIASEYPTYYVYSSNDLEYGDDILSGTGAVNILNYSVELKNTKSYEDYMINAYGDRFFNKVVSGQDRYKEFGEYSRVELDKTGNASISIFGIPEYIDSEGNLDTTNTYDDVIAQTCSNSSDIKICVTHNADLVKEIASYPLDAVITGGTHGNKNDNDLDKGKYIVNGKSVYVSGGVGSFGTKRFFNFPEFELITLTDGTVIRQNPLEQVLNTISKDDPILNSDAGFKEWERKSSEETETEQET